MGAFYFAVPATGGPLLSVAKYAEVYRAVGLVLNTEACPLTGASTLGGLLLMVGCLLLCAARMTGRRGGCGGDSILLLRYRHIPSEPTRSALQPRWRALCVWRKVAE